MIAIVILLILAGISISALTNTGIFQKATDAKSVSENAENEQSQTLGEYERELNKYSALELTEDKMNKVLSMTENTFLKDANGNNFTLPAGFKVVVNEDTNNAKTVDKGIVIEDATVDNNGNVTPTNGSQFVWVPVGDITKEDGTIEKINLDRYMFANDGNGTPISQGENVINSYYSEEIVSKGNTIAKNLSNFKNSVVSNEGFYIGRYEARTVKERTANDKDLMQITEKSSDPIYNYVNQKQSAILSQNMYNSSKFTSDLINSYAWDTATLFLQTCGDNDIPYSWQTTKNTVLLKMGTENDKQCNIFDMASNVREWTTETSLINEQPCVDRGGIYNDKSNYMSIRVSGTSSYSYDYIGFRPIIYINN